MKKLKVFTVLGTRPELIRLSRIISLLDTDCDHRLIHTGQNYDYELNQIFFDDLRIRKPDIFLNAATGVPAETIGNVISLFDKTLATERPDAVVVLGDTNSCLAVISAKRRQIPIFHLEAGNRSFDMRVPEEINRRIVDHISDINLTYSQIARDCLLREGLSPDLVINVGSPMAEVLGYYKSDIERSDILERLKLYPNEYFVVSAHREENIDSPKNFDRLVDLINGLPQIYKVPVVMSVHPRTKNKIASRGVVFEPKVLLTKPLGFFDYVKLQQNAKIVFSDSGTISEESSILNFPALNIRETQERHEAMEEGSVMLVGLDINRVNQCIGVLSRQSRGDNRTLNRVSDYCSENVSEKVVRIVHSYVDYVNRVVWRKY
jgi:UDP-N-acetylglucosamine 2-epimerase